MSKNKISRALKNPDLITKFFSRRGLLNWIPDDKYLSWLYKKRTGEELDLEDPKTYNEKLQYLKLYNRDPKYTQLVDKYEVRQYVAETIGEEYLIPLLGVWNHVEEIDFDALPNQFVLKTTHDSGGVVICENKATFDVEAAKKKLKKSFANNYYDAFREWPYKNVQPRIIAEKYINQIDDDELRDYRFFCFEGEPQFIAVDFSITDKSKTRRNLYDLEWNLMSARITYPNELEKKVQKPEKLDEMIELSRKLSEDMPHVRVDFYNIGSRIIFGELTFFHQSGFGKIIPEEFAVEMGSWIDLSGIPTDSNVI